MADLTTPIDTIMSGRGAISPGPVAPSPIASLANLGSGVMDIFSNQATVEQKRKQRAQQDQVFSQEQQDRADKERKQAVENTIASGYLETLSPEKGIASLLSSNQRAAEQIAPDAKLAADKAIRLTRAARQGRASDSLARLGLETTILNIQRDYPDQAANVFSYLRDNGLDHILFRDAKTQEELAKASQDASVLYKSTNLKAAIDAGLYVVGDSDEANAARGAAHTRSLAELEATTKQLSIARSQFEFGSAQEKHAREEQDRAVLSYTAENINKTLGVAVQNLGQFVESAGNDPTKLQAIENLAPTIQSNLETSRQTALNTAIKAGASQSVLDDINKQYDTYGKQLTDIFSGPLSRVQSNTRSLSLLSTATKLDAANSMKLYTRLTSAFGRDVTNQMFEDGKVLTEEQLKGMADEARGFASGGEMVSVMNMSAYMRNERDIRDLRTPKEREQALKLVATATKVSLDPALAGDAQAAETWRKAYSQGLNAAIDISPPTARQEELINAGAFFFGPKQRNLLKAIADQEGTVGEEVILGSRNVAVKILTTYRNRPDLLTTPGNPYQRIQFQGGQYRVVVDTKAFDRDYAAGKIGMSQGTMQGGERTQLPLGVVAKQYATVAPALQKAADTMNAAVDHLSLTTQYDHEWDGIDQATARKYWTGQKVELRNTEGVNPTQPKPNTFDQQLRQFGDALSANTADLITNPDTELAGVRVGPREAVSYLANAAADNKVSFTPIAQAAILGNFHHESGGFNSGATNPKDGKDGSDSIGFAQWNGPRAVALKKFAEAQGANWRDPSVQFSFAVSEMTRDHPGLIDKLNNAKSVEEATKIFMDVYERPNQAKAHLDRRVAHAKDYSQYY